MSPVDIQLSNVVEAFCEPVSIEDVAFLHPVHIGSIVEFTAQVIAGVERLTGMCACDL